MGLTHNEVLCHLMRLYDLYQRLLPLIYLQAFRLDHFYMLPAWDHLGKQKLVRELRLQISQLYLLLVVNCSVSDMTLGQIYKLLSFLWETKSKKRGERTLKFGDRELSWPNVFFFFLGLWNVTLWVINSF